MSPSPRALLLLLATFGTTACVESGRFEPGVDLDPVGAYQRITPGYDTEAACRAANPDALFNCTELISLCDDGNVQWLFTDIVFSGTWTAGATTVDVVMESFEDGDGSFVFEHHPDGSLYSAEVYGDRAFAPTTEELQDLCR